LELAARIGQKLLADNQALRNQNEYLEEQLLQATDKVVLNADCRNYVDYSDCLLSANITD